MSVMRITLVAAAVALAACSSHPQSVSTMNSVTPKAVAPVKPASKPMSRTEVDAIVHRDAQMFLHLQPTLSTSLSLDRATAGNYNMRLPDYSPVGFDIMRDSMAQAAKRLASIDLTGMTRDAQMQVEINQVIDEYFAGDKRFPGGYIDTWGGQIPYVVNQIWTPVINVPSVLQDQQPVTNVAQAQDYLSRLDGMVTMLRQVQDKVQSDAKAGIILPLSLYPKTMQYLNNFVADKPSENGLVVAFANKLSNIKELNKVTRQNLLEQATTLVGERIYPEFHKLVHIMLELKPKAPKADGIWAQPGGAEFYRHQIKYLADSDLTPEQIHELGLSEVKRISSQMDKLLRENGMSEGTVGERMIKLGNEPRFRYPDTDAGRQELLHDASSLIKRVMAVAPQYFATLPSQPVKVRRVPVVSQASAPGGYYSAPALDGSRPGEYFINLRAPSEMARFALKTLTYHEAVPGHHFQIALNMAQKNIGIMRQNAPFNAFAEGWALYAEHLASEMGMYKNDPWGDLGRLQAELYRAVRLVVDTGIHYKKWTRQQAIDYFHATTGSPLTDVTSEVERYIAMPGQALGYKLGMMKLLELRKLAKQQLGDKFDIKQFHDVILLPGARPMALVEKDVKDWIAKVKAAK